MTYYALADVKSGRLWQGPEEKVPRLWAGLRGPRQIVGKGQNEANGLRIVRVTIQLEA